MQNNTHNEFKQIDKPSKTQRKLAMHALQRIGEQLVELNDKQLDELNLPEQLFDAVKLAQGINKFGARQRQLQYIGKLMRYIDVIPIQEKLKAWQQISVSQVALLHQIEHWRERILSSASALTEFAETYPGVDIQQIRLLARNTLKEKKMDKPTKSYRLLFQAIQKAVKATRE